MFKHLAISFNYFNIRNNRKVLCFFLFSNLVMKTWDDVGRTHCFSPRHLKEGGDAPIFADLPDVTSMWEIHPIISFYMERNDKIQKILCIDHTSKKDIITDNSTFARYLKKCDNRVIFITHGFLSGDDEEWLIEMRDALLYVEDQIVAIVGWKGGADFTSNFFQEPNVYKQAAVNCLAVGKWVGQVATWLHTAMKRQGGGYLWGIGHSLGAHLMGMAGHVAVDKVTLFLFFEEIRKFICYILLRYLDVFNLFSIL